MYVLVSGEGPTDFGLCNSGHEVCAGEAFLPGPMAVIVDQLFEAKLEYSALDIDQFGFVPEHSLAVKAKSLGRTRNGMLLPGRERPRETAYFYSNARALAAIAIARQTELVLCQTLIFG